MKETLFLHYGRHTLRATILPDGQLMLYARDTIRVLCAINGTPTDVLDRMPESDNPNDYAGAMQIILSEVRDRPETQAFGRWIRNECARLERT